MFTPNYLEYIEIIPWKVRTNDFYSRVAINHKKWTSERSEWISILMHRTFHDMKFLFHSYLDFFSLNKKFQRLKVDDFSTTNVKEDDFIELLTFKM